MALQSADDLFRRAISFNCFNGSLWA